MVPNGFRLDQCLDGLNCRVREDPQLAEELVIGTKVDIGVGLVPQRPPFSISKRAKPDRTASFSHPVQFFLQEPAVRGWNGKGISVCKISSEHFGAPKSITRVKGSGMCVALSGWHQDRDCPVSRPASGLPSTFLLSAVVVVTRVGHGKCGHQQCSQPALLPCSAWLLGHSIISVGGDPQDNRVEP